MKMLKSSILIVCCLLSISCKEASKSVKVKAESTKKVAVVQQKKSPKAKVGKGNSLEVAKKRTHDWFLNLDFNIEQINANGFPLQKHFAEYLGLGLKLYSDAKTDAEQKLIKDKLQKVYDYTLKESYHNLGSLDAKNFKKNSMSYLRILYLLEELEYDTTYYKKQLSKVKSKIDIHLKVRGDWQKCAFENYYNYFKLDRPVVIKNTQNFNGVLAKKLTADKYTLGQVYELTHFVFIAYEYGAKRTQTKFDFQQLGYLDAILPELAKKYRLKNNRDILSELVTCMKLLGTQNSELKNATDYLLHVQNNDGSWGNYERARKKYGDIVEVKIYLHTALVVYESLTL